MENYLEQFRAIEQKWQSRWQKDAVFNGKIDKTKPKWFITVPYPYTSGPLHIGHCRTYNLGDIFARYKRQTGFNVMWPMAYHITGTPILSISSRIERKEPKVWDQYRKYVGIYEKNPQKVDEIISSFTEPMNVAMYFAKHLMQDWQSMGFSLDTSRQFTTGDPEYKKFIEWQYHHLHKKEYITKGTYPILWCKQCQNAVGEDDILGGDEQKVEVSEFVGMKYKFDAKTFIVAATLRPETIYGATNLWVHPDATYSKIHIDGEQWIVAGDVIPKLREQNHEIAIIEEFPGSKLVDHEIEVPWTEQKIPIYPAIFVNTAHATGVVYSVPAHAPFDYAAIKDLQADDATIEKYNIDRDRLSAIMPISIISVKQYGEFPAVEIYERMRIKNQDDAEQLEKATQELYRDEFYSGIMKKNTGIFAGMKVEHAKDHAAIKFFEQKIASKIYEVSRKVQCRCGETVSVAILKDQYFLNYANTEWKMQAKEMLDQMTITPKKYRSSFEFTFNWLDKRPCVRKRGIGTEFPITKGKGWIIESLSDSVIYMAFYTIIRTIHEAKIEDQQLTIEFFDYIFKDQGNIDDVFQQTNIPKNVLNQIKQEFEYWYPNDFRHTAIAHISNHLSFAVFHHAAIFAKNYWLKSFSLNNMLIREGKKMGKSKGNVIPMAEIPKKYSVDLTRLHLASVATADSVIDWKEQEVMHSLKRLIKFWELVEKYPPKKRKITQKITFPSRLFQANVKYNFITAQQAMNDRKDIREYGQNSFFNNIRLIEEFERNDTITNEGERKQVISELMFEMAIFNAPLIPHLCEEIYEKAGQDGFVSFAQFPEIKLTEEDRIIINQGKFIEGVQEDINNILKMMETHPKHIYVYVNAKWKSILYSKIQNYFDDRKVTIPEIMKIAKEDPILRSHMKLIATEAKLIIKNPSILKMELLNNIQQITALKEHIPMFRSKYPEIIMEFIEADAQNIYDPKTRASKARPMKPALYME
ncbi:Leucine--tRNA ligase [Candidatus Lokiarchaeum ossiferum]|uniref:Leucine--tRNA ligase n=1 Tax=Candidatus Lokiarchaeum ossiferum TaxID=2951803 RepID=A0ABY6HMU5_9ARCH|nr:Leucine--tRNA ligase [Candidatus Lokiarchaeum sp. B-35]